jgi:hypothetical protein
MRLTLMAGLHDTFYDHRVLQPTEPGEQSVTLQAHDVSRQLVDLRAHLEGPTLRRRYPLSNSGTALLHVIASRLDYRYVPEVEQDDVPPFETLDEQVHLLDPLETFTLIDRIAAANYTRVSLFNTLLAQQAGGMRQVARLVLSQGLDFRHGPAGGGRLLGPLDAELDLNVWASWHLISAVRLQPATADLDAASTRLLVALPAGWAVRVGHTYRQNPDVQYVTAGVSVPLWPGLRFDYDARYDGLSNTFREHVLALHYVGQCWSVDLRWRIRDTQDTPFFASTSFFIQVHLLNL